MSFPAQVFEKEKVNCLQKCFYMMNLIRQKNVDIWEMYQPVYENLKVEESWEFYHMLVDEYRKLLDPPAPVKKSRAVKKKAAPKKTATKKKPAARKTAKAR